MHVVSSVFAGVDRWRSIKHFAVFWAGIHTTLCLDLYLVTNLDMTYNTDLATNLVPVSYDGRARNAGLSCNHIIFTDFHIMRDLDKVVYLGAFANDCEPMVPRSILQLEPISTWSPKTTLPSCGIFW